MPCGSGLARGNRSDFARVPTHENPPIHEGCLTADLAALDIQPGWSASRKHVSKPCARSWRRFRKPV